MEQQSEALDYPLKGTADSETIDRQPAIEQLGKKKVQQYTVEGIFRHLATNYRLHYILCWCVCGSKNDTVMPMEHMQNILRKLTTAGDCKALHL